jgi:hypothetical protein
MFDLWPDPAGWRDNFLGHVFNKGKSNQTSLGPHVNVWRGSKASHFFY